MNNFKKLLAGTTLSVLACGMAMPVAAQSNNNGLLNKILPKLEAECKPCFGQSIRVIKGGNDDNFVGSSGETTSPRSGFNGITGIVNYQTTHNRAGLSRNYDEKHHNEFFIETLNVPGAAQVQKGWVVLKTKDSGGLVTTDSIMLGDVLGYYKEAQDATNEARARNEIEMRVFAKKYTDFRDDVNSFGDPVFKLDTGTGIIYANMADIELRSKAHKGTTNLLEQMKADGLVDLLIQDDTMVDFFAIVTCVPRESGKTHLTPNEMRSMGLGGIRPTDRLPERDQERLKKLQERINKRTGNRGR